jgi:hypothetical protein
MSFRAGSDADAVDHLDPQVLEIRRGLGAGDAPGAVEAREALDPDRPVGEPIREILVVLLGQQGRRHQHRHLLAGADGDEGRVHPLHLARCP